MTDKTSEIAKLLAGRVGPVSVFDLEVLQLIIQVVSGFGILRVSLAMMEKYPGNTDAKLKVVSDQIKTFEDDTFAKINALIERIAKEQPHG